VTEVEQRIKIGRPKLLATKYPNGAQGGDDSEIRNIAMVTVIGIILADVFVFMLFAYQYRQELGLTVNGAHDLPVVRKKQASKEVARAGAAGDQANRRQQIVARP
jgi:hypothetical protein